MSWRLKFLIILGVLLVHTGLFLYFGRLRALPKARSLPRPTPAPTPNFFVREDVELDPATGERIIHREIQVSTKLADPSIFAKRATPAPTTPQPNL